MADEKEETDEPTELEKLRWRIEHVADMVEHDRERRQRNRERDLYLALGYLLGVAVTWYTLRRY